MLHGLSPEERRWLERKVRQLGGLEPALRLLLRQGRVCDLTLREWEEETRGGARMDEPRDERRRTMPVIDSSEGRE